MDPKEPIQEAFDVIDKIGVKPKEKNYHVQGLLRVRLVEDANEYQKKGTVGRIKVTEFSINGDIISANFYPEHLDGSYAGFGQVIWPRFESVTVPQATTFEDGTETVVVRHDELKEGDIVYYSEHFFKVSKVSIDKGIVRYTGTATDHPWNDSIQNTGYKQNRMGAKEYVTIAKVVQ